MWKDWLRTPVRMALNEDDDSKSSVLPGRKKTPQKKIQMSPCSPPLNVRHRCKLQGEGNSDNPAVTEERSCQKTWVRPVRPCQGEVLLSIPQDIVASIDITIIVTASTKMDPLGSMAFQQPLTLCDHIQQHCDHIPQHCCSNLANQTEFMSHKAVPSHQELNVLHISERKKDNLQCAMVLPANNPPINDQCDEPQNDSGYGSWGLQPNHVFDSINDFDKLKKNSEELLDCDFYYGSIDSQKSRNFLRKKPTGTFLIRDSSDSRYLYSLSVKTEKGATSVRILYSNGLFQFDSDERIRHKLPQFDSVLALLDFHVKVTEEGGNKLWRWEEISGCKSLTVELTKPLKNSVPSLAHLSRVKINQCLNNVHSPHLSIDKLPLDSVDLKKFLHKYPFRI